MFIYMSKKIAIPKQSNVTCISWNHSSGYIAVGGEDGMLKVLKLESGGGGNLSMNLSLEGHTGQVCVAIWNEVFQKLTTSDEHGVIIVWMLYKGSWYEEMINNRNKSTVRSMAWGSDGQKICIAYEDGAVIVGSVDGSRVWGKDIKGPGLAAVQWSPDNSQLLFALTNGELHIYDDQGNFTMPVAIHGVSGSMDIVTMDWYSGSAPASRPVLAISYRSGVILLMKNCNEEAKAVSIPVVYVTINSKAIVVAASKESFLIWKFSTPSRPRSTEHLYQADGSPMSSTDAGFHDDTISCVASSDTHLLIGRDSGSILLFSLVNFKKITSINMNSRPYRLGLNSNSSKFFVIDQPGSLYLLETDMANNISIGQALRKDVWSALWASDNPQMLAVAEKARLYVMRDTEPEEPLTMQGYLCKFKELEITTALLDSVDDKCTPQHIVRVEVKSLRDTRQLIEKVGLKEAENFIKDNPHPQLWLLLAEAALKNFESESALETAEAAFVRRNDYAGIKFVSRLNALHSNALKKADILAYFKDFDAAEKIYHNEDRRDLAIALRKRLGHWFRVVELLKMSASTTDAQVKQAYSNIGDYYIDRQNWTSALEYYTMSNNTEGLKKCYMALEDNEALSKLYAGSPRGKLANLESSKKASPLKIKKLYVLAGHLYSQSSVARAFELCSKALIKLEALDPQTFENLAIEIFTRYKPKDAKGNKIECPNCDVSMPEWCSSCGGCGSQFPECAVSGRALVAPHTVWACGTCGAHAQQHELVLRHSCPMCHAQLA
ncbi:hypothetical protein B5X24_HaOG208953 [Helicoverpa armigera]|uniref:Uncharacterized protein n=1 Tax=Helicoverpa armigera TaxID=29058 RepID=A0A2W1BEZ8_HELAM|nr:hypothetical protein B5X24_HaOG208953 [Helicoverpa armigera]